MKKILIILFSILMCYTVIAQNLNEDINFYAYKVLIIDVNTEDTIIEKTDLVFVLTSGLFTNGETTWEFIGEVHTEHKGMFYIKAKDDSGVFCTIWFVRVTEYKWTIGIQYTDYWFKYSCMLKLKKS